MGKRPKSFSLYTLQDIFLMHMEFFFYYLKELIYMWICLNKHILSYRAAAHCNNYNNIDF